MTNIPEGSIIITPTEVYNEVKSLTDVVRKLVAQDEAETVDRRDLRTRVENLETRVGSLDRKFWMIAGAAAGAGGGIGSWLSTLIR